MSYSFTNRYFGYLMISFCIVLLFFNSCTSFKMEKLSVSRDILKQYVGSYRQPPDSSIARVTLEDNQLFISSCKLIELKQFPVSEGTLKQYIDNRKQGPDQISKTIRAQFSSEVKRSIARVTGHKKYPVYAKSETKFYTKTRFPAQIEFFKNDKGEVTHFIVKKKLSDHIDQRLKKNTDEELDTELTGIGIKIRS